MLISGPSPSLFPSLAKIPEAALPELWVPSNDPQDPWMAILDCLDLRHTPEEVLADEFAQAVLRLEQRQNRLTREAPAPSPPPEIDWSTWNKFPGHHGPWGRPWYLGRYPRQRYGYGGGYGGGGGQCETKRPC